jgi:serine/threonine protein kinase
MSSGDTDALLAELADEFTARLRAGEVVGVDEYVVKHPGLAADIEDLFPTIVAVEGIRQDLAPAGTGSRDTFQLATNQLGEFQLLREVGRGGMGIVYEAVQESLSRRVALKLLPPAVFVDEAQVRRFQHEAETASRLHHPNIVPIFDVGKTNGIYHYSMQFIDGPTLAESIETQRNAGDYPRTRSDFRAIAELGCTAAHALHYAHTNGVLHRDIKPSNLLLQNGEQLMMADFGIAKMLDDSGPTNSGEFVGTLHYAAPEQFGGLYDLRSDVYALGLTLYELATLQRAHNARTRPELIGKIQSHSTPDPSGANTNVPRDLATIIGKACAHEPSHRYESAGALADDLRRFINDQPIDARPVGSIGRLWRWCRRNPLSAATSAVAAIAFVTASVVGWFAYVSTSQSLQRERVATQTASKNVEGQRQATRLAQGNLTLALEAFDDLFNSLAGRDRALVGEDQPIAEAPLVPAISGNELAALQRLLAFYDRFAIKNVANRALQEARARSLRRVGDIHAWLGDKSLAVSAYQQALTAYQEADGDGSQLTINLAVVHKNLGRVLGEQEDLTGAFRHLKSARDLLRAEVEVVGSSRSRYELARAHNASNALRTILRSTMPSRSGRPGFRSSWARRWPQTESAVTGHHKKAVELANSLLKDSPHNQDFQLLLARSHRISAQYMFLAAQGEVATEQIGQAIEILDHLSKEFFEVPNYRLELIESYLLFAKYDPDLANAENRYAIAAQRSQELSDEYPDVPRYHAVTVRALREQGRLLQKIASNAGTDAPDKKQLQERARQAFIASITACEAMQQRFPLGHQHLTELLETRLAAARLAMESSDKQGACDLLQRALAEVGEQPKGMVPLSRRTRLYREMSKMCRDLGQDKLAKDSKRLGHRAGREAFRQGLKQGMSLLSSRLWQR